MSPPVNRKPACRSSVELTGITLPAGLVLVARFVKRPALGIRLVTNEPPDGENDIAVVA